MENKVLATIGAVEITEKDLENIIMRYPEDKRAYFLSDMGKKQVLEQMISFELMNRLALELKLNETEEYKANLKQLEKDLLTQMAINKVLSDVTITDEDAKKFYDENKDQFAQKEAVSAKHILVDNEEKCKEIKEKINNNEITFEEAAKQYSTCPSGQQGGDLGMFNRGMMVPEFEEAAFTLDINEVSEPVKTQFGYHLIKVENKKEATTSAFEEVKTQIIQRLMQQAQDNKYLQTIKDLEAKHNVQRM